MPQIRVSKPLQKHTGDQVLVEVSGATAGAALDDLIKRYPGVEQDLYDASGNLISGTDESVNVLLGKYDIRELEGADTPVTTSDKLIILRTWPAAISGPQGG